MTNQKNAYQRLVDARASGDKKAIRKAQAEWQKVKDAVAFGSHWTYRQ